MLDGNISVDASACNGGGHFSYTVEVVGRHTFTRRVHLSELQAPVTEAELEAVVDVIVRLAAQQSDTSSHAKVRSLLHGKQLQARRVAP